MKFMLVFQETAAAFAHREDPAQAPKYYEAWNAYIGALKQSGVVVNGHGLQAPRTGASVRIRDGRRQVQDGPFADTKEHLGGYFVIEVASMDEALEWAARSPSAAYGTTDVRPVMAMPEP